MSNVTPLKRRPEAPNSRIYSPPRRRSRPLPVSRMMLRASMFLAVSFALMITAIVWITNHWALIGRWRYWIVGAGFAGFLALMEYIARYAPVNDDHRFDDRG